ncbi:MAG: hypothetical protein ACE5J2_07490 [Nitrososphaerales archaeon]
MKTLFDLDPTSREYLDRMNMIENLVWDMAKIVYPFDVIEPEIVSKAKDKVLDVLKNISK